MIYIKKNNVQIKNKQFDILFKDVNLYDASLSTALDFQKGIKYQYKYDEYNLTAYFKTKYEFIEKKRFSFKKQIIKILESILNKLKD